MVHTVMKNYMEETGLKRKCELTLANISQMSEISSKCH